MSRECEAPGCDDDMYDGVPVKLKMSVTLSCAGWWCGGGGGWRGLTGLTVGKHGYRWRLAAARRSTGSTS